MSRSRRHQVNVTEFSVPGEFTLCAPEGWYNARDPDVFLLMQNDSLPGSGIFVDYKRMDWPVGDVEDRLAQESERFLNESVIPNAEATFQDAVSISWGDGESKSFRTFATMFGNQTWVFQLVFHVARQTLYLLHWNGDSSLVKSHICGILDTFTLLSGG
jgi:hypothetical protein